jgi:hypothetical protein
MDTGQSISGTYNLSPAPSHVIFLMESSFIQRAFGIVGGSCVAKIAPISHKKKMMTTMMTVFLLTCFILSLGNRFLKRPF